MQKRSRGKDRTLEIPKRREKQRHENKAVLVVVVEQVAGHDALLPTALPVQCTQSNVLSELFNPPISTATTLLCPLHIYFYLVFFFSPGKRG